jgi:UDP-N-acetylmuramate dehydrogenase
MGDRMVMTSSVEPYAMADRVLLRVQAGEPWDRFVEACVRQGLAGIECLSGIPGSVGATPIQNVGAYGQEVSETIVQVRVYDRLSGTIAELSKEECGFTYRSSVFKRAPGRWVVLAVTYALERQSESRPIRYAELARALGIEIGDTAPLGDVRAAVLRLRKAKGMVLDPEDPDTVSAGSFFLNPVLDRDGFDRLVHCTRARFGPATYPPAFPEQDGRIKTSAAWLIERAGYHRGYGNRNGIALSSKHTLALTNRGHGTTAELLALAGEIANSVWDQFGVALTPEPVLVGHTWTKDHQDAGQPAR